MEKIRNNRIIVPIFPELNYDLIKTKILKSIKIHLVFQQSIFNKKYYEKIQREINKFQ
jgi:hypothetical protein